MMVAGPCTCNSVHHRALIDFVPTTGGVRHRLFIHCHKEKVVGNTSDPGPKCGPRELSIASCSSPSRSCRQPWCSEQSARAPLHALPPLPCPLRLASPRSRDAEKCPCPPPSPFPSSSPAPAPARAAAAPVLLPLGAQQSGTCAPSSASAVRGWSHRTCGGKRRPEAPRSAAEGEGRKGPRPAGVGAGEPGEGLRGETTLAEGNFVAGEDRRAARSCTARARAPPRSPRL